MPISLFEKYVANLTLSDVKRQMLSELWTDDVSFPKQWVKSSRLLAITNQKYFDRRLRELRDAQGLDIETKYIGDEHCWRINSGAIAASNARTYLTATQKANLFAKAKNTCAVCKMTGVPGVRGLQADHKVPLIKGGAEDLSNWQVLCNECNVAKRGMCKNCDLDCDTCAWANPEKVGFNYIFRFNETVSNNIRTDGLSLAQVDALINKLLEQHFTQTSGNSSDS